MVPFDLQAHDNYFIVGHLHYVLIGGVAFPIFAAASYGLAKFSRKLLSERLGRWNFWLMFVGTNVAFFPMHIVGLMGMARRVYTYPEDQGWEIYNLISTIGGGGGSVLGALLTFATTPWYPPYVVTAPPWGLSGLTDQQLAGVIMWAPGGLAYLAAALVLVLRSLGEGESTAAEADAGLVRSRRVRSVLRERFACR